MYTGALSASRRGRRLEEKARITLVLSFKLRLGLFSSGGFLIFEEMELRTKTMGREC